VNVHNHYATAGREGIRHEFHGFSRSGDPATSNSQFVSISAIRVSPVSSAELLASKRGHSKACEDQNLSRSFASFCGRSLCLPERESRHEFHEFSRSRDPATSSSQFVSISAIRVSPVSSAELLASKRGHSKACEDQNLSRSFASFCGRSLCLPERESRHEFHGFSRSRDSATPSPQFVSISAICVSPVPQPSFSAPNVVAAKPPDVVPCEDRNFSRSFESLLRDRVAHSTSSGPSAPVASRVAPQGATRSRLRTRDSAHALVFTFDLPSTR
jgi:hypothetical protein